MQPLEEISHRSAKPGIGREVTGSLRVSPSKRAAMIRKSSMPVPRAGSNVSGSGPLIVTRLAGGSEPVQPAHVSRPTTQATHRRRTAGKSPGARGRIFMEHYLFVPDDVSLPVGAGAMRPMGTLVNNG